MRERDIWNRKISHFSRSCCRWYTLTIQSFIFQFYVAKKTALLFEILPESLWLALYFSQQTCKAWKCVSIRMRILHEKLLCNFFFQGLTLEKVLSTLMSKVGSTEGALTFCQHSHSFALLQATFLTLPSHVHVHFTVTTVLASIYCIFGYATSKEAYGQGWVYDWRNLRYFIS